MPETGFRETLRHRFRSRIRYRVTGAGWLYLGALVLTGVGAFFTGNNLLFLVFAAMMALLLVSGFLSRLVLAGLELELLLPRHVYARSPAPARLRVRNLKRLTPSFSIEVAGAGSFLDPFLARAVYLPLIPGAATLEMPVDVIFPRRGRQSENLFLLSTSFPFGFIHRTAPVELIRETMVYPALAAERAGRVLAEIAEDSGRLPGRRPENAPEFHGIRPLEASDDARRVDWKGTARTGSLQVREFAHDKRVPVRIEFDPKIVRGQEKAFEDLIETCAAVCQELAASGTPILFRCEKTSLGTSNGESVYDILILLALVSPVYVDPVTLSSAASAETRWRFSTRSTGTIPPD